MRSRAPLSLLFVLVLMGVSACDGDERPRVLVAAASDLRFAFEEMERPYEAACECDLVFTFGSSGLLATQIEQGLNVDVFASADSGYVDRLEGAGLIDTGTEQMYAVGRIVIASPAAAATTVRGLQDLTRPEFNRIAIANPEHAPYGRAAQQAMESADVWDTLRPRLVFGENASLATQFVETRNVEAGIVPLSLAVGRDAFLRYVLIDESLHQPLRQVAAVTSRSRRPELARGFLEYINGPAGRPVMRKYGFILPGESPLP